MLEVRPEELDGVAGMTVTVVVVVLDEVLVDLWVTVDTEAGLVEAAETSAELVVMQAVGDMKTDSVWV